jgi:5,10-methylenetetrahydromethanopterin reductase
MTTPAVSMWTMGISHPGIVRHLATDAEASGWDGMFVVDSQNLAGDPFVGLALAASVTTTLHLGTGVTNPATRHPAAAAAAIASVQAASQGRAALGIGRGDSALAHLGLAPAPVADLERYVQVLRRYLRADGVGFDELTPYHREGARPIDALGLADAPHDSRLHWLDRNLPIVPVEVVASGPRVLRLAAANADRVLLAVGADPDRIAWAIEQVRDVDPDVPIGAFVNVVPHDDIETARHLASGGLATFARFSVMDGRVRTPTDDSSRAQLEKLHAAYDMRNHTRGASGQAATLEPEFIDRFGIVGPPDACVERLRRIADLGIDKLIVVGPSIDADPTEARRARATTATKVLPALRDGG